MMAVEKETGLKVEDLPMSEIFSDPIFNVRGLISSTDVIDLARNIETNGLLQPITVQPYHLHPPHKWRIVVGHRRYEAFKVLNRVTIPSIIKHHLSELDAFAFNYIENVNRKDLNMLQEARGIRRFKDLGITLEETSKIINKATGWIRIRFILLTLPEEIQEEAAAGMITQEQIKDLATIPSKDEQFAAVRRIKDARLLGEKRIKLKTKKKSPIVRKPRDRTEITKMLGHVLDTVGPNLLTRGLAWANGEISDVDLYRDLLEFAKEQGLKYEVPKEALPYLSK